MRGEVTGVEAMLSIFKAMGGTVPSNRSTHGMLATS